jgi:hypothetical protein
VPLWAFAVISTVDTAARSVDGSMRVAPAIFTIVVVILWNAGLLNGLRWLWIATVALLSVFLIVSLATEGIMWFGDLASLFMICLLVLPHTRRFFRSDMQAGLL